MDSDDFDDIFRNNAAKSVRAGAKFQPKAKPRPQKRNATTPFIPSSQQVQTTVLSANEFTESCEAKNPSEPDERRSSGTINASSEHATTSENVDPIADLGPSVNIFIPDSNEDWHTCFQKSVGETPDIFIELDSLGDFLPDTSTVLDNAVSSSEAPAAHAPGSRITEERLADPLVAAIDGSACFSNVPSISLQPGTSVVQDPLTGSEATITTSPDGCPTDNQELVMKELESYPCLETLETSDLTNGSGQRIGKFQPKPKLQAERTQSNISDMNPVDCVSTIPSQQDSQLVPPENNFMDQGSIPAFTQSVLDFSSFGQSGCAAESASDVVVDAEQTGSAEALHSGAGIPVEHLEALHDLPEKLASHRAKARKSTATASDLSTKQCMSNEAEIAGRSLRKRKKDKNVYQPGDNSEEEAVAHVDLHSESPSTANGNSNGDKEFQPANESHTKEVQKKSKKNPGDKEKPARKRKKDNETSDQAAKVAPKKFPHSTRRRVNKKLLETPEDEINIQKVPLRDLILLAEHKERMAKRDAAASQAPPPNQSAGNSVEPDNEDRGGDAFQQYYGDEPFASEHGEANNEESSPRVEESSGYFNYQTYMDKTPVVRWSKQDTELFYEAVRQFGTDLSMIQQLFPGRTRRQVKLKYKKEERQHPLRLRDALTNRSKDHSHFELVIDRLRQIAAEEKQNSNKADSVDLMGEEEMEEETPETNDNKGKSEQLDEDIMNDRQQDFTQVHSPVKTYDSEDDLFRWSQYKSED